MTTLALSSPKPQPVAKAALHRWYRFYAMFTEQFVQEVIQQSNLPSGSVIHDPWLGSGTTVSVATAMGMKGYGIDISPVMTTIASGRCLPAQQAKGAVEAIEKRLRLEFPSISKTDPVLDWFKPQTARAIRGIAQTINRTSATSDDPQVADFLMTALFETAWKLATNHRSKNPTWIRLPAKADRSLIAPSRVARVFLELAKQKSGICDANPQTHTPTIQVGSAKRQPFADSFADMVLTSPPYCTRIDYAVTTRLESAILGNGPTELRSLRDEMMGTSTIRAAIADPSELWGKSCNRFLKLVHEHKSKSSASYYYKTYLQYFDDLHCSLLEINRCIKAMGHAVIVVQDSFYKGIHTDLAQIICEMVEPLGWHSARRIGYEAIRTMRRVNTRSRKYRDDTRATETVLWYRAASKS